MKSFFPALVALAALFVSAPAFAADDAADRTAAIAQCRTETAARAGVGEDSVRLDTVRTRARTIRVDVDVWSEGALTNVRCDFSRSATLTLTAINLPEAGAQQAAAQ